MARELKFSLLTLTLGIALVAVLAAAVFYLQPREYSRHSAPDYAIDMMEATEVTWDFSAAGPPDLGARCEINYPPDPKHRYILIMSIHSQQGKVIGMAGAPGSDGLTTTPRPTIGSNGFFLERSYIPEAELPEATIWAEIRIEDEFGNVLFHGVKESETYQQALAKSKQASSTKNVGLKVVHDATSAPGP